MERTREKRFTEKITPNGEMIFHTIKELFTANTDERYRVFVNQGGTSSAKTYTLLQVLLYHAIREGNSVCTVVGQDLPNLKVGAMRDTRNIIGASEWLAAFCKWNESTSTLHLGNGSLVEFKSYDSAQDAKSGKRDYLFVNEANGITYEIYWQLAIRTRKCVWIDYNPSARFWVHDEIIGREGVRLIISDHRGNPFLTEDEHERIENIADPELWKVYARGLTGKVQGLVFTNWDIVDALPDRDDWKMSCRGLDFGYSCFKGDTLIMTLDGEKPIQDVRAGDYVLTRKGYRRVKRNIYNGYKKVIQKKFVDGLRNTDIFCTFEHNFNANGKWKKYGELTEKDNLFMLSNSMAWSIADTQVANIPTTTITSGRRMGNIIQRYCTMQSMRRFTEKSPMVWLYITRISIRLIMTLAILLCSLLRNICAYITTCLNGLQSIQRNIIRKCILKRIGTNAEKRCLQLLQQSAEYANGAGWNIHQQTPISDFVESDVIINGNIKRPKTMCRWFASGAEKLSMVINTLSRNVAAMNVPITYQQPTELTEVGVEYCDVYDLWIDGIHEYFANGILVHNCDPSALEHVVLAHGDLWIDEEIYSTGLTNTMLAEKARTAGVAHDDQIIADSAEPKSIAELRTEGLWVTPSVKGRDSIIVGLDILRRYKLHITRRSLGLLDNVRRYSWSKDREGNMTNKPEDSNNHGIDAVRYVALAKLNVSRPARGVKRMN